MSPAEQRDPALGQRVQWGLRAAERGLRGALGGGGANALPLREAQPWPGLRAGHERDHRTHIPHVCS